MRSCCCCCTPPTPPPPLLKLSLSAFLISSNEKKPEWAYLKGNELRCWDGIRLEAACRTRRTKYALVPIWSRELCELCSAEGRREREGGREGGNRHKWSNYLGMRSLFGSISSRLWPRETQPSRTTACVISSLRPPRRTRTFFRGFGRGTFCPTVGFFISPSVEQLSQW